ncbi:MAG: hypothetical protein ACRCWG_03605 [Sarcina sp.]
MRKLLVTTLLLTTFTSLFALPVYADTTDNCESTTEYTDSQNNEKFAIPIGLLTSFASFLGRDTVHANHTITNWVRSNSSGYSRYVSAFNDGGRHCYNNCPTHRSINPYNYGFKNSYKCHQ